MIDADEVARDVTAPGEPALDAVIARFGERYRRPDGGLDRAALAELVFTDPAALRELETITHPARPRADPGRALRADEDAGVAVTVIEAIKLVEGPLADLCDEIWLVTCDAGRSATGCSAAARTPPTRIAGSRPRATSPSASGRPRRGSSTRRGDPGAVRDAVVAAWHELTLA